MWTNSPDTQVLLDQARRGDATAVEQLLAHHREPVRRMIGMRLDPAIRPRVDASDVVQEVLLEASRRLADYLRAPTMPFHLWLRHIARDHLIDAHRRHRQAQRRTVDRERRIEPARADASSLDMVNQLLDPGLTPATAAMREEIQGRFQSALDALPEDDREIVLMRHFEQLSNQDVASALALTEAAASMRYLRAIRRLRALLLSASDSQVT
jgi:RNA polymerase sigma-70 factor (ECF subfamily)